MNVSSVFTGTVGKNGGHEQWLVRFAADAPSGTTLVCYPFAGGSAAYFASWARRLARHAALVAVQYPGRCSRASEPALTDFDLLVECAARTVLPLLDNGRVLFFGHSFGALLAFEVAHWLRDRRCSLPAHLFLSAREAPDQTMDHVGDHASPPLDDASLLAFLRHLHGQDARDIIGDNSSLLRPLLPGLRGDLTALRNRRHRPYPPLQTPITVMGGADDPACAADRLEDWRRHTSAQFARHIYPGGHFYLNAHRGAVLNRILETAGPSPSRSSSATAPVRGVWP